MPKANVRWCANTARKEALMKATCVGIISAKTVLRRKRREEGKTAKTEVLERATKAEIRDLRSLLSERSTLMIC